MAPSKLPSALQETLVSQAAMDPGLPVPGPTISYWQLPPHSELSHRQSETLPAITDIAIIGSGITACSIAKNLLEKPSTASLSVTVLEARSITSGASGRNGGGLASFAPFAIKTMVQQYGEEKTIEIARFTYRTLEKMYEIGNSNEEIKQASEIRRTREVTSFSDEATFKEMKDSFLFLERMLPEANLKVEILDPPTSLEQFGAKTIGGTIRYNCGAFWPYRFITTLWQQLHATHKAQLNIETSTPVLDIFFEPETEYYELRTPRGNVKAKKVIHATNGYSGHLLPGMRGKIFPVRGYMSAQQPGDRCGSYGCSRSWSFFEAPSVDLATNMQSSAAYYGNQSPNDETIFWGSDMAPLDGIVTSDDSIIPDATRKNLANVLTSQFDAWREGESPYVKEMWAGTMGYTADHLPFVGELPTAVTNRGIGGGEWICAGFNGAGMCQCWSSGEALVKMISGEDVSGVIPDLYIVTKERLDKSMMNAASAIEEMFSDHSDDKQRSKTQHIQVVHS